MSIEILVVMSQMAYGNSKVGAIPGVPSPPAVDLSCGVSCGGLLFWSRHSVSEPLGELFLPRSGKLELPFQLADVQRDNPLRRSDSENRGADGAIATIKRPNRYIVEDLFPVTLMAMLKPEKWLK